MKKGLIKKVSLALSSLFLALTLAACGGSGGAGADSGGNTGGNQGSNNGGLGFNVPTETYKEVDIYSNYNIDTRYPYLISLGHRRSNSSSFSLFDKETATINLDSYTDDDGFLRKDLSDEEYARITGEHYVNPKFVKVALFDESLSITKDTTRSLVRSGRVKVYYLDKTPVNNIQPNKPSHSEHIINVMMAKNDSFFNFKKGKLPVGLMRDVGEALVISEYPGYYKPTLNTGKFYKKGLDRVLDSGYHIINASYGLGVNYTRNLDEIKNNPNDRELLKQIQEYEKRYPNFDSQQIITRILGDLDADDIVAEKNTLTFLQQRIREKDLLLIKSNGNDERNSVSLLNSVLSVYKEEYKDFLKGFITVTSYKGSRHTAEYANHCKYLKEVCIAALDISNIQGFWDSVENKHAKGTSFAAPYVSATAAIVKGTFPFMTNSELQQTILTTAKDIGKAGIDDRYGWGLVQPQSAVLGPKLLLRDFYVDLSRNPDTRAKNYRSIYYFYNPIKSSEDVSLIVKNNLSVNVRDYPRIANASLKLYGSGNDFKGKILVKDGGRLGIFNNYKYAKVDLYNQGVLYGNGVVGDLLNRGVVDIHDKDPEKTFEKLLKYKFFGGSRVSNGTIYEVNNNNFLIRSNLNDQGSDYNFYASTLKVNNNYYQGKDGVLVVSLGKPLLVKGKAVLEGKLKIANIREAIVKGGITEYSILSPIIYANSFAGKFSNVDFSDLAFVREEPEIFIIKSGDSRYLSALAANIKFRSLVAGASYLSLNSGERYYAKDGVNNLFSLENKVQNKWQELSLTSKGSSLVKRSSALEQFYLSLKSSSKQEAKDTLLAFSGSEYSRTFRNNQALSTFNTNELWVDHGHEQGLTSSYTFQQALANQHYNARSNRLALAYGTADYHLLGALNYSNSSWDNPLSLGKSSSDHKGLNLLASYNHQGYNFGLGLDYNHHHNKVRRELNILGKAYNFTQSLAHDSLDLAFLLAKDLEVNNFLTVSPYLALSYEYHKLGAFQESFSTGGQDFTLGSQAKHYSFVSPLAGVKFYKTINNHLDLLANFSYKFLPKGEVKAQLADQSHNIEQSFSYASDHLFAIKGGLNYHFNKALTLDVKGGVKKLSSYNGWTKEARVSIKLKI